MEPQRLPEGLLEKARLIERSLSREISEEEQAILDTWLSESAQHQTFFDNVTNKEQLQQLLRQFYAAKAMTAEARASANELVFGNTTPIRSLRSRWKQWTAAAAILLLIATSAYFWYNRQQPPTVAQTGEKQKPTINDVAPGQYKAMLTLSDGRKIVLDSAATGKLVQQGNISAYTRDGQLVYEQEGKQKEILYNTLSTQKGQTYATVLSDGTKVWLNSQSSILYPVSFNDNVRKVEVTGEAYFEVAPFNTVLANGQKGRRPFVVKTGDMEIEVLGTHFNVNNYADEEAVKATLLEGKVSVHSVTTNSQTVLAPGEQVKFIKQSQALIKTKEVDIDAEVAWRFGYFNFSDADVKSVMRQLERWYNVEVVYEGNTGGNLGLYGKIPRGMTLSQVLNLLQGHQVHFKMEGKKIIVTP